MAQYTTGDLARLCGVSVRTVQYYDSRGILSPSALSEGGRRLYTAEDLDKLKVICFLRSLELPIDSIRKLLQEEHPEKVIGTLLERQENDLTQEIARKQSQVLRIADTKRALRTLPSFSTGSLGDVAYMLENKAKLKKLRIWLLAGGLLMDAIQVCTLMVGIFTGLWWPFAAGLAAAIGLGVWISSLYFTHTAYICPECHRVFRPALRQSLFARHTPHTRKLTCPHCGHHGFCVEVYGGNDYAEN